MKKIYPDYRKYEKLRDERLLSNLDVSKASGVSKTVLYAWKSGERHPGYNTMMLLSEYFGVPMEYFGTSPDVEKAELPKDALRIAKAYNDADEATKLVVRRILLGVKKRE